MFSTMNSPAIFESLPLFNKFENNSDQDVSMRKRQKHLSDIPSYFNDYVSQSSKVKKIDYSLNKISNGNYNLQLFKLLPKEQLLNLVEKQVRELREKYYIPNYQIVNDIFGNQYCIEDKTICDDEIEKINEKVYRELNLSELCENLAKKSFRGFEFEISRRRNNEFLVSNYHDNIYEEISLDDKIIDFRINNNYNIDDIDSFDVAVLEIELITENNKNKSAKSKRKYHHRHHHKLKSKHPSNNHSHNDSLYRERSHHIKDSNIKFAIRKNHHPILEDVNDEEFNRYQELQELTISNRSQSESGYIPIIEEI